MYKQHNIYIIKTFIKCILNIIYMLYIYILINKGKNLYHIEFIYYKNFYKGVSI